jgi:hypothetical protein
MVSEHFASPDAISQASVFFAPQNEASMKIDHEDWRVHFRYKFDGGK